jgi:hypothetical protein
MTVTNAVTGVRRLMPRRDLTLRGRLTPLPRVPRWCLIEKDASSTIYDLTCEMPCFRSEVEKVWQNESGATRRRHNL